MKLAEYPVAVGTAIAVLVNLLIVRFGAAPLSEVELVSVAIVVQSIGGIIPTLWTRSVASLNRPRDHSKRV